MTAELAAAPSIRDQYSLLASAAAGVTVGVAPTDGPTWTDGRTIHVTDDQVRRQVLLQAALIAAGSLSTEILRQLQGHPALAKRYLLVEGHRALKELDSILPPGACRDPGPWPFDQSAHDPEGSLEIARSTEKLPEPPEWFGVLRPRRMLSLDTGDGDKGRSARDLANLQRLIDEADDEDETPEEDEDDETPGEVRKVLQSLAGPLGDTSLARALRKLMGKGKEKTASGGGSELPIGKLSHAPVSNRRGVVIDLDTKRERLEAPPVPGVAVYPEWDERKEAYRPDWCTVIEVSPRPDELVPLDRPARHDALRRELGRLGLGVERQRHRKDGHDFDIDAAIDARVAIASGQSPDDAVYVDNLWRRRELGVLVLLDASGSGNESSPLGGSIHERQRDAAAAFVDTLAILGDRVAAYAFRSWGRSSVAYTVLKTFDEPFGASTMARIGGIEPAAYTRFGAAIRHGSHLLQAQAGTPYKLLVVISDGFPYDDGYEGRYAEGDVRKALEEARASGVGCLCLNFGSTISSDALARIYGSTAHAAASDIDAMAPSLLRLFRGALITSETQRRASRQAATRAV